MAWEVEKRYKLVLGIPHKKTTFLEWTLDFRELRLPEGTLFVTSDHPRIDKARNEAVKACLEHKADFLAFIDTDLVVPSNAILRLMNWNLPIVGGVYRYKKPPFHVNVYFFRDSDKMFIPIHVIRKIGVSKKGKYVLPLETVMNRFHPYYEFQGRFFEAKLNNIIKEDDRELCILEPLPDNTLLKCDGIGCGLILIKREVLEAFGTHDVFELATKMYGKEYGEDIGFTLRAKRLYGFEVYADLGLWGEHIIYAKLTKNGFHLLKV